MFGSYPAVLPSSPYFEVWLFQLLMQVQRNSTRINLNCQAFHSIKWLLGSRDNVASNYTFHLPQHSQLFIPYCPMSSMAHS